MNKLFKVVFNKVKGMVVVCSELSKSHGKSKHPKTSVTAVENPSARFTAHLTKLALVLGLGFACAVPNAYAGQSDWEGDVSDFTSPISGQGQTISYGDMRSWTTPGKITGVIIYGNNTTAFTTNLKTKILRVTEGASFTVLSSANENSILFEKLENAGTFVVDSKASKTAASTEKGTTTANITTLDNDAAGTIQINSGTLNVADGSSAGTIIVGNKYNYAVVDDSNNMIELTEAAENRACKNFCGLFGFKDNLISFPRILCKSGSGQTANSLSAMSISWRHS